MDPLKNPPPVKVYVKVNSDFDAAGTVMPRAIVWADGRSFKIDAVRDFRPASADRHGREGDCYTVMIKGEEKKLYFERTRENFGGRLGRWWVESRNPAAP